MHWFLFNWSEKAARKREFSVVESGEESLVQIRSRITADLGEISKIHEISADSSVFSACLGRLEGYLSEILEINKKINLTAIRDFESGLNLRVLDSIQLGKVPNLGDLLDWGSGGGFPGVPLFLLRETLGFEQRSFVCCLDSRKKKVSAVSSVCDSLGISGVDFFWGRGEEVIQAEKIRSIVMRAVAPVEKTISWLDRSVPSWYIFASEEQVSEWENKSKSLRDRGFSLAIPVEYSLEYQDSKRFIVSLTSQ